MKFVMGEWKDRNLHSGSKDGPLVKDKAQAVAIGLNSAKKTAQKSRKIS